MATVPVVSARVVVPSPRPSQIGRIRPTRTGSTTTCSKGQRERVSPLAGAARVFAEYRLDTSAAKKYLERGNRGWHSFPSTQRHEPEAIRSHDVAFVFLAVNHNLFPFLQF